MELLKNFFDVLETVESDNHLVTTIKLNPSHIVYTGHFPGNPVTPGVIQMQIVHELLERYFAKTLRLETMPQCKFLKVLNPLITRELAIHIEWNNQEEHLIVHARGESGVDTYFKLNSIYQFK